MTTCSRCHAPIDDAESCVYRMSDGALMHVRCSDVRHCDACNRDVPGWPHQWRNVPRKGEPRSLRYCCAECVREAGIR